MIKYVLCYVESLDYVLLIHKKHPRWQFGSLNLPGGKVEQGEDFIAAATRELYEEADLLAFEAELVGIMRGEDWEIGIVRCIVKDDLILSKTDEIVEWIHFETALKDSRLIKNLRIILPLLKYNIKGWTIRIGDQLTLSINYNKLDS